MRTCAEERVYYVIEGRGVLTVDHDVRRIFEGDAIYVPAGLAHQLANDDCDGWLGYLVIS